MGFWTRLAYDERPMKGSLTRLAIGIAIPRDVGGGSACETAATTKERKGRTKAWGKCIWQIGNVRVGYEECVEWDCRTLSV